MSTILPVGYLRWDGTKYVTDPDIEIIGPVGPTAFAQTKINLINIDCSLNTSALLAGFSSAA